MEACRESENVPTAAEMSRDLQANFDEGEWKKYCECTDFKWTRVTRHEGDWWFGIGGEMFPLMKEPAYALVWVPTVVTQCDSMLSVMGAKFNRRQAHLAPHVAANQLFMRCGGTSCRRKSPKTNPTSPNRATRATMINFTSSSKKKILLSFPFGFSIVIFYLG